MQQVYKPAQEKNWESFLKLTQSSIWSNCGYLGSFGMESVFDWVDHIALYTEEKTVKVISSRAWVPVFSVFHFLMRVDFLRGLFGCYCFQGVCLLGFCLIFHLHDIFWELCFRWNARVGPAKASFPPSGPNWSFSTQWIHHFAFTCWEFITHLSPDWLRCLFSSI